MKISVESWKQQLRGEIKDLEQKVERLDERIKESARQHDMDAVHKYELEKQRTVSKLMRYRIDVLPTNQKFANQFMHSDITPYEVLEEKTPDHIVVRRMDARLTPESKARLDDSFVPGGFLGHFDNSVQKYEFFQNEENHPFSIRRHKDGNFYMAGTNHSPFVVQSRPQRYYDYNF